MYTDYIAGFPEWSQRVKKAWLTKLYDNTKMLSGVFPCGWEVKVHNRARLVSVHGGGGGMNQPGLLREGGSIQKKF